MNQFANFTKEQFDALVQAEVEKHLSSREEAEARKEAEEALSEARETFETLKASLEAKDAKIKEYEDVLANLDLDPTAAEVAANDKVIELETQVTALTRRAEVAEAALETLAKEETAATRMSELEEAGVALDGEDAEAQYGKIRAMSDEDYESYKRELIALKAMYASTSEEVVEETDEELAALSTEEIGLIAQSLGCDPSDSKCISLVSEVAAKMAEISACKKKKGKKAMSNEETPVVVETPEVAEETPVTKEVASTKLSLGEAITRAMDQNLRASASLKEELAQAWENVYAEKHGEKKSQ